MKKIKMLRRFFSALLSFALICGALWYLNQLFLPDYSADNNPEGGLICEYYRSDADRVHDVIIVGDCEMYSGISTVTLWKKYGISSFVRASPSQYMGHSYALLAETFEIAEKPPSVVVCGVSGMKYDTPRSEEYNRMTLDGMKMSQIKLAAASSSLLEGEELISYAFPILRYHDRWSSLGGDEFVSMFTEQEMISYNGCLPRAEIIPADKSSIPPPLAKAPMPLPGGCFEYLEAIRLLCVENGATLILLKAPALYPHWYSEWDGQIREYAEKNGIRYLDFGWSEIGEMPEINWQTDTYDGGLHLNIYGADKLSAYLGDILSEYGVPDRRFDEDCVYIWSKITERYDNEFAKEKERETANENN